MYHQLPSTLKNYRCQLCRWSISRLSPSNHRSATASAASLASCQWRRRSGRRTTPRPRRCASPGGVSRPHHLERPAGTTDPAPRPPRPPPPSPRATCCSGPAISEPSRRRLPSSGYYTQRLDRQEMAHGGVVVPDSWQNTAFFSLAQWRYIRKIVFKRDFKLRTKSHRMSIKSHTNG